MSKKLKSPKRSGKWAVVDQQTDPELALRMSSQDSMTSQLSASLVPHEESVLELYFQVLSQGQYDKAKDIVDSEKDGHKFSYATSWNELLQCLSQLASAEKNYTGLVFLGQKRLSQIMRTKDSSKSIYSFLLQECHRMENVLTPDPNATFIDESDQLLAHISGQLCFFVLARLKMIDFYEQLSSLSNSRHWMNFEDLVLMCEDTHREQMKGFHHPLLVPLKTVLSLECETLCHLLHAQILMSKWEHLPCVLELHSAHSKLNTWVAMIPMKEVKSTFGRSSSKSSSLPAVCNWLFKLKAMLLSKFGLYFYETLSKQTTFSEMKTNFSKTSEDFVGRIQVFQKKTDATKVMLILDSQGLSVRSQDGGYVHPEKFVEPRQGLETFPSIFTYPSENSVNSLHWPNILMLINSSDSGTDKKYFYDRATEKRPQSTYFISRVDPRISLVVLFESKKAEKDSNINSFITDMTAQLRCQLVLASIKTFAKS